MCYDVIPYNFYSIPQNTAACLVSGARFYDHSHAGATPAALALGSEASGFQDSQIDLPFIVRYGSGLLVDDYQKSSEEGRRQQLLCSTDSRTCVMRRTYSNFRDQYIAAAGQSAWNSLPTGLRQTNIACEQFKWLL